jgi:hypothetical protein
MIVFDSQSFSEYEKTRVRWKWFGRERVKPSFNFLHFGSYCRRRIPRLNYLGGRLRRNRAISFPTDGLRRKATAPDCSARFSSSSVSLRRALQLQTVHIWHSHIEHQAGCLDHAPGVQQLNLPYKAGITMTELY